MTQHLAMVPGVRSAGRIASPLLISASLYAQLISVADTMLAGVLLLAWWPGSHQRWREILALSLALITVLLCRWPGPAWLAVHFPAQAQLSLVLVSGGLLCSLRVGSLAVVCAGFASLTWVLLTLTWRGTAEASTGLGASWAALLLHGFSALIWIRQMHAYRQPRPLFLVAATVLIGLSVWFLLARLLGAAVLLRHAAVDSLPILISVLLLSAGAGLLQAGRGRRASMRWWLAPCFLLLPPLLLESMGLELGLFGLATYLAQADPGPHTALPLTLALTLLVGVLGVLAVAAPGINSMRRDAISWACGLFLLLIAVITLVGLASGMPSFSQMAISRPMAALVASGLICLGTGLCAAGLQTGGMRNSTVLLPLLVAFGGLWLAIALSLAVRNRIDQQSEQLGVKIIGELKHALAGAAPPPLSPSGVSIKQQLAAVLDHQMPLLSGIRISDGQAVLYRRGVVTRTRISRQVELLGRPMKLEFWLPDLDAGLSLPLLLLLSCVLLSCALAVAIRMGAIARERHRQAQISAEDLKLRVAEREHAYELLHDSEAELSRVLHSISDAFYVLDEHWRFVFVNPQAELLLRRSAVELLGKELWSSFPELAHSQVRTLYERAVSAGTTEQFEFYFAPWNSWLSLRAYPQRRGLAVYFRDVTARKRTELALIEANQQAERAQQMAGLGHWEQDGPDQALRVSAEGLRILGLQPEQLSEGLNALLRHVHEDDREALQRARADLWSDGSESDIEFRVVCGEELRYVHEIATRRADSEGRLLGITGALLDLTRERRTQQQLRDSEQRFRVVTEVALDAVWEWNLETDDIWWSYGMSRLFGFAPADLEPDIRSWTRRVHPDDQQEVLQSVHAAIEQGEDIWTHEYRFQCADGRYAFVRDRGMVIRVDGRAVRMIGAMTDLSERKQAEVELARLNRALRMRSACSEALIRAQDEAGLLTAICDVAVQAGGYRMAWVGYAHDDDTKSIEPMASAGHVDGYLDEIHLNWSSSSAAGSGPAGRAIRSGAIESCIDIEAQGSTVYWRSAALQRGYRSIISLPLQHGSSVFAVLNLYASEIHSAGPDELQLLNALADDLAHGIQGLRAENEQQLLHMAALKMATFAGADGGSVLQQIATELPSLLGAQAAFIGRLLPGAAKTMRIIALVSDRLESENLLLDIDGTAIEMALDTGEIMLGGGAHEQLGAFNELLGWSAEHFVCVRLDHSRDAFLGVVGVLFKRREPVSAFHLAALHLFAVRIAAEIERLEANAVIRRHARMLDEAHDAIMTVNESGQITYCNDSARRHYGWSAPGLIGQTIDVLFPLADQAVAHEVFAKVMRDGAWTGEVRHCRSDGQVLDVESRLTRVQEPHGERSVLVISTDIGARKHAQRQLEQTLTILHERNRELREFAFVASHDLQEPLRKVRAYAERLTGKYAQHLDARGLDYFERMTSAVNRMQRLIDDLLAYSRVLSGKRVSASVELGEVVQGVLSDLEELLRETQARLEVGELPVLMGDPSQLRQVFQNLIGNALKYRSKEREPHIALAAQRIEDHGKSYWQICVSDNGIGFSEEFAEQIFAPFHRLHGRAEYEGSGIGLAIVRRIIDSVGGSIRATARVGEGARFIVRWPLALDAAVAASDESANIGNARVSLPATSSGTLGLGEAPSNMETAVGSVGNQSHIELDALLDEVRRGDVAAQQQLKARYEPQVRALLRRNRALDEMQLQRVMAQVFSAFFQAVRNGQVNDSRTLAHDLRALLSRHSQIDAPPPEASSAMDGGVALHAVVSERVQQAIRRLLDELPVPRERELVLRFYLRQQSSEQICTELQLDLSEFRRVLGHSETSSS